MSSPVPKLDKFACHLVLPLAIRLDSQNDLRVARRPASCSMPSPSMQKRSNVSPRTRVQRLVANAGRELFKQRAYEELRSRLLSNQYQPGNVLSERQLAAELGMSKTPVKAALERLETEGYIIVSPQQGIRVIDLTDAQIADLYEIRVVLESYVLRQLAGRLTPDQHRLWSCNLDALDANTDPRHRELAVALDTEFHILPCRFLGNQEILKTMQQMASKIQRVIHHVFALMPDRAVHSLNEHRDIVHAVLQGEAGLASRLIDRHLQVGHAMLREARMKQPAVTHVL